jgi:hypothetical protein
MRRMGLNIYPCTSLFKKTKLTTNGWAKTTIFSHLHILYAISPHSYMQFNHPSSPVNRPVFIMLGHKTFIASLDALQNYHTGDLGDPSSSDLDAGSIVPEDSLSQVRRRPGSPFRPLSFDFESLTSPPNPEYIWFTNETRLGFLL